MSYLTRKKEKFFVNKFLSAILTASSDQLYDIKCVSCLSANKTMNNYCDVHELMYLLYMKYYIEYDYNFKLVKKQNGSCVVKVFLYGIKDYTKVQGRNEVYGIRDQRPKKGWDQGSQPRIRDHSPRDRDQRVFH